MFDFKKNHPYKQEDEIFLGNFNKETYEMLAYKTKRMGHLWHVPRSVDGEIIPTYAIYPVFIKKYEIQTMKNKIKKNYIKHIKLTKFLGTFSIDFELNEDVNIICGANGSGKSTLLDEIHSVTINRHDSIEFADSSASLIVDYIYDSVSQNKFLILQQDKVDLSVVYSIADEFIYGKKVIREYSRELTFQMDQSDKKIPMSELSSGEKSFLYILLTVAYQNGMPSVLIVDDPETHLHIVLQKELIDLIRKINPNCQIIFATHSPQIISHYWDETFHLDELKKENDQKE